MVRLRQILNNLVGNAIKFTGRSGHLGWVKVRAQREGDAAVRITVADNGIGMTPEVIAKLFTPFTQADSSTTRSFGGSGLGLSICKDLVGLLGGNISVESTPEVGSLFSVVLPIREADIPGVPPPTISLAGLDCIVVMPDRDTATDLSAYLEHAGARVEVVADLAEAAQLLAGSEAPPFTIVISEACLPLELPALRAVFSACLGEVRHMLLTRGHHRRPNPEAKDVITVDGNAMRHSSFIYAVALAAGRADLVVETEQGTSQQRFLAPSVEEAASQGRLVLVAEDNHINQRVIMHQLATLGYACEMASDGIEALNRWRTGRYALLLSDMHMPGLDGHELATRIRSEEGEGKHLPIIAFTANITMGERERCRQAGMDDYLSKPVQLDVFKAMLDRWISPAPVAENGGDSLAVLDSTVLPKLLGDDSPAVIAEFLGDYLKSANQAAVKLRAAALREDWKAVGAEAHRLKSSSRSVGALALGECCGRLEEAGNANAGVVVTVLVEQFEGEFVKVRNAIECEREDR